MSERSLASPARVHTAGAEEGVNWTYSFGRQKASSIRDEYNEMNIFTPAPNPWRILEDSVKDPMRHSVDSVD